jgi:non-specific protein-tyrosine kinase
MDAETSQGRYYLRILKRHWGLMLAVVVTVVLVALLVTLRMTPVYEAETRLELQPFAPGSSQGSQFLQGLVDPATSNATQVELIQSDAVLGLAGKNLGLPSRENLKKWLTVALVPDTEIVRIVVDNVSPQRARDWADGVGKAYIEFRQQNAIDTVLLASQELTGRINALKAQIGGAAPRAAVTDSVASPLQQSLAAQVSALESQLVSLPGTDTLRQGGGTIVAPAQIPFKPARPSKSRNLILAAVLGLFLAGGVCFLAESLDDRVRTAEEIEHRTGVPVLGRIPRVKEWADSAPSLARDNDSTAGAAEGYRTLQTNLRFSLELVGEKSAPRTILVTSALAEEGKSTTAANLAAAFAQGGFTTILLSADLRRPTVHQHFGLTDSPGLLNVLRSDLPVESVLQTNQVPNLRLLSAGGIPPNPTEILSSRRLADILAHLRPLADIVIVDTPPLLGLADASALAPLVDGVLLVVEPRVVRRRALSGAAEQVRRAGGHLVGTVLNRVAPNDEYGTGYYGYYGYTSRVDHGDGKAAEGRDDELISSMSSARSGKHSYTSPGTPVGPERTEMMNGDAIRAAGGRSGDGPGTVKGQRTGDPAP